MSSNDDIINNLIDRFNDIMIISEIDIYQKYYLDYKESMSNYLSEEQICSFSRQAADEEIRMNNKVKENLRRNRNLNKPTLRLFRIRDIATQDKINNKELENDINNLLIDFKKQLIMNQTN